jgi:ATP-dependent helicase/DNAse subunit B
MSENKMYLSYSSLVKLTQNPKQFHKEYILGERETLENRYLKQGGLFHLFVLEPENFDEKFIVLPEKLPSDSVQQVIRNVFDKFKVTADEIFTIDLIDLEGPILQELKEINLYQSYKTDKQRMDKVASPEGILYFNTMRDAEAHGKVIVDMKLVNDAKEKAHFMLANDDVGGLLHDETMHIDVRKEMELKMDLKEYSFGLKGIIDLLRIDAKEETIHIVDFKTTSKSLDDWRADFVESPYMYWLQMMIYKELVYSLVPEDSKRAWKLKVWFPVIDKDNQVYVFPVSTETLHESQMKAVGVYDIAEWHISKKIYDLPYSYEKGIVEL